MLRDLLSFFLSPFHLAIRREIGLTLVGSVDDLRVAARRLRFLCIKGMEIVGHRTPSDPSCSFLTEIPWLRSLRIFAHPLSDLEAIQSLSNLHRLTIQHVGKAQALRIDFERLRSLRHLTIEWFRGGDSLFAAQGIETLNLSNYGATTSASFSRLPNLRRLRLAESQVTEINSFAQLQKMHWLALLRLERLAEFSGLSGHKRLRFLWIESCPNLRSLEFLRGMDALETLRILDCGSVAGIESLLALPQLRHVFIHGDTRVAPFDSSMLRRIPHVESVVISDLSTDEMEYWSRRNRAYDLMRSDL